MLENVLRKIELYIYIHRRRIESGWKKYFHRDHTATADTTEGVRHFSPESLVKNRVEPIACIPRCSVRLDLS